MFREALTAALLVISGCALDVSYSDSHYACDPRAAVCPSGYSCSSEGFCETRITPLVDGGDPADVALLDDGALPPDAPPGTPDARPRPDAATPPPDANAPPPPDAAVLPDANVPPQVVTLVASRDTQLYSPNPTFNFGDFAEIMCASDAAVDSPLLFGFSLTSIPSGATVESAILHVTTSTNALTSGQVSVYQLLEDWTEGTLDGMPGVASYNQRKTSTNWSTAGAKPPSRASSAAATFVPNVTNTTFDVTLPKALVQGWVSNAGSNFGLVMTCSFNQDVAFYTRASLSSR